LNVTLKLLLNITFISKFAANVKNAIEVQILAAFIAAYILSEYEKCR
jgi:hypothetical protein